MSIECWQTRTKNGIEVAILEGPYPIKLRKEENENLLGGAKTIAIAIC